MKRTNVHRALFTTLFFLVGFFFTGCIEKNNPEWDFGWKDATREDLEAALQSVFEKGGGDVASVLAELIKNENVERAVSAADENSLVVKYKDNDDYYVYPLCKLEDPFDEDEATRSGVSVQESFPAADEDIETKANSTNKIAVFNYFSNDLSRRTQNSMLEYMMNDVKNHGFVVEYYPYEKMTISNLSKVSSNDKDYKAVIIITHGFTVDNNSYFVLGEEYDKSKQDASYRLFVGPDEAQQKVPRRLRFWNQGFGAFGFNARYDCAIDISKMIVWEHTILYMGSCDAYRCDEPQGTSIGWDGNNVTAQAHVTLLMYNLMRGKSLADALDQQESPYYDPNPYFRFTGDQYDTWTVDRITKANMKCSFRGRYAITPYGAESLTSVPNYYKDGLIYVSTQISYGPLFLNDNSRKVLFSLGVAADLPVGAVDYPDKLYIKVTPLRSDASPKTYTLEEQKTPGDYGLVEFKLPANGLYVVSAFADESMTKEILFRKPMVFVKAKPFKENSGEGDEFETETITANGVSFKMVRVAGGTFTMKSGFLASPKTVTLKDFSIGQTEVTQELWEAVMGYNPSSHKGKNLPVESVSWNDCQKFLQKLNSLSGKSFSLPMMAEYEYAARGGQKTHNYQFAGSNEVDDVAWYIDNSDDQTHPVALKGCNELGLYDLSGNVWEISCDISDYGDHCTFGGCAFSTKEEVAITSNVNLSANDAYNGIGFRLAISDGPIDDVPPTPVFEAIDLGLSVKWANFNLGATKPEEYGDYYAWGETEPYYSSLNPLTWKDGKEAGYEWPSYKWCMGSEYTMTKYCTDGNFGYNGFTDGNTQLIAEDDAAYVNLGSKWRIPTDAEWTELRENCTWTLTYENGVGGFLVTSKVAGYTNQSIFLPNTGFCWYTTRFYFGILARYWSSTNSNYQRLAYSLYLDSDKSEVLRYTDYRCQGFSIRPVMDY